MEFAPAGPKPAVVVYVMRVIAGNLIVDLGYIGSDGSHLAFVTDLNQVPAASLEPNDASARP